MVSSKRYDLKKKNLFECLALGRHQVLEARTTTLHIGSFAVCHEGRGVKEESEAARRRRIGPCGVRTTTTGEDARRPSDAARDA